MVSRTEIGTGNAGHDNQLAATTLKRRQRFDKSYGAMTMIMGYLPRLEQLKMQGLDKWWYVIGVGRVQVRLDL